VGGVAAQQGIGREHARAVVVVAAGAKKQYRGKQKQ